MPPITITKNNYKNVLKRLNEYASKGKYVVTKETSWLTTIVYSQTYLRHGYISHPNHMVNSCYYSLTPSYLDVREYENNPHFASVLLKEPRVSKEYYAHLCFGDKIEFHDNYFIHAMNSSFRDRKNPHNKLEGNTVIRIYTLSQERTE